MAYRESYGLWQQRIINAKFIQEHLAPLQTPDMCQRYEDSLTGLVRRKWESEDPETREKWLPTKGRITYALDPQKNAGLIRFYNTVKAFYLDRVAPHEVIRLALYKKEILNEHSLFHEDGADTFVPQFMQRVQELHEVMPYITGTMRDVEVASDLLRLTSAYRLRWPVPVGALHQDFYNAKHYPGNITNLLTRSDWEVRTDLLQSARVLYAGSSVDRILSQLFSVTEEILQKMPLLNMRQETAFHNTIQKTPALSREGYSSIVAYSYHRHLMETPYWHQMQNQLVRQQATVTGR